MPSPAAELAVGTRRAQDTTKQAQLGHAQPGIAGPGTAIDSFTLQRHLGAGAMGSVWLARETITDRLVAIKLLSGPLAQDPDFRRCFARETSLLASLDHPHIAAYAGHGLWRGLPYLASEFVAGTTLSAALAQQRQLDEATALALALQLADGLDYAWERRRLIHRDLKPANLMLRLPVHRRPDPATRIVLIDLGLACGTTTPDSLGFDLRSRAFAPEVTGLHDIVGTPLYMAPEQSQGSPDLDWRCDLYALGVVLFHALTGEPPYTGLSLSQLAEAHRSEPIPDPGARVTLHAATCTLIKRCLAKDPRHRYPHWSAFHRAARSALSQCERSTHPTALLPCLVGPQPRADTLHAAPPARDAGTKPVLDARMARSTEPATPLPRDHADDHSAQDRSSAQDSSAFQPSPSAAQADHASPLIAHDDDPHRTDPGGTTSLSKAIRECQELAAASQTYRNALDEVQPPPRPKRPPDPPTTTLAKVRTVLTRFWRRG